MRAHDDPLRADNVREAARKRKFDRPVRTWKNIETALLRAFPSYTERCTLDSLSSEMHDDAFAAGVAYALRAVRNGSKP